MHTAQVLRTTPLALASARRRGRWGGLGAGELCGVGGGEAGEAARASPDYRSERNRNFDSNVTGGMIEEERRRNHANGTLMNVKMREGGVSTRASRSRHEHSRARETVEEKKGDPKKRGVGPSEQTPQQKAFALTAICLCCIGPLCILPICWQNYEAIREHTCAAHREPVNAWLHSFVVPIEWITFLAWVETVVGTLAAGLGRKAAEGLSYCTAICYLSVGLFSSFRLALLFSGIMLCVAPWFSKHLAASFGRVGEKSVRKHLAPPLLLFLCWVVQVPIGHWAIEGNNPSILSSPFPLADMFLSPALALDCVVDVKLLEGGLLR